MLLNKNKASQLIKILKKYNANIDKSSLNISIYNKMENIDEKFNIIKFLIENLNNVNFDFIFY